MKREASVNRPWRVTVQGTARLVEIRIEYTTLKSFPLGPASLYQRCTDERGFTGVLCVLFEVSFSKVWAASGRSGGRVAWC